MGFHHILLSSHSSSASSHSPTPSLSRISGVGSHLLNLHLMTIYNSTSFIDQFLGDSFSLKSNETEVLGFIVLRLVDWSDNLCNCSKLTEVVLDVLLVASCLRQLTNIALPLLDISLLYSDGLTLNLMF